MKPTVYLAGPIQHVPDGGHGWRDLITDEYEDFDFLNPLDKYDVPAEAVVVHNGRPPEDAPPDAELVSVAELVESDKSMIDESDAVLVGWDDVPSAGTPMEVLYAHNRDIPVIIHYEGGDISPWMTYHSNHVHHRWDDCMECLAGATFDGGVPA